jgi:RNA polymerase sigma factor (sigma-70 family)
MVTTANRHAQKGSDHAPRGLWYAPERRIRTDGAAREAKEIAAGITENGTFVDDYGEDVLFKGLQTCAYQAARPARGQRISRARRRKWAGRWRVIRDHIVERNMPLVYWLVSRRNSSDSEEDALLSEASLVLVRSVERFNPWLGYRFSTYASNAIIRAMMRLKRRERRYRALFPVHHDVSFERPVEWGGSSLPLYLERLNRALGRNTADLSGLESNVITQRFGLDSGQGRTLQEIGKAVGLSKERVRQLQHTALRKLRETLREDPVLQ